ncbi:MAG TPA: ATP-binding protein [Nocardioides sp.]
MTPSWAPRLTRGSVRARTTLLAALVSAIALVAGAVLLLATLDRSLHRAGDDLARGRVRDLAAQAERGVLPDSLDSIDGEGVGQVYDARGRVLAASPNIAGRPPIFHGTAPQRPSMRILRDAPDDDETENYRVWVQRAETPTGPVTVVAGASLESVGEASATLRRDLGIGVPAMVALVAIGTWLVVGRSLRPVEAIRREVAAIGDDRLDRRVPEPPAGDEIGRLAVTMNGMLDRLEDASRRQREFVADASHELQSPIAALRTQLEVALAADGAAGGADGDWADLGPRLLADADQMDRLVRDLLFLASTPDPRPPDQLVDLDDVVLEEAARIRASAPATVKATVKATGKATGVPTVDTGGVSAAPVAGDAGDLRRLVRNLLENAARHAESTVRLTLGEHDGAVLLEVYDDGPGIAPEDRERVFERFTRIDSARRRTDGTGLGLAIARAIAERHRGTLEVGDGPSGTRLVLRLPVGRG